MYEPPIFPIRLPDRPQAPHPEGRLLISLDNGDLLCSLPYTNVHWALHGLRLCGLSSLSDSGQSAITIIQALTEADRRGCR